MKSIQGVKGILLGVFLALALVLAACGPTASQLVEGGPRAWVGGPPDGSEVPIGEVSVMCHSFARGGVSQIELYVNGSFANRAPNPNPGNEYFTASLTFETTGPGSYVLHCRTHARDGEMVQSDPVTVRVPGELPSPVPTEPGVPTATPTSTEVPPTVPPPPTVTPVPPTATRVPPTATPIPPTRTPLPPTSTPTTPPRPTIQSLEANPPSITKGSCTRVSWAAVGVINAVYFDGEGVGDHDFRDKCPGTTTTYTLRAVGPGGETTADVTVVVTGGDTQGPSMGRIGHSPSLIYWDEYDQCQPTYPISVTINAYGISDPSGVSAVKVTYRVVESGRPAGQWQSKNMTTVQTGLYSATIGPNDLELSLNPPVSYGYGNQSTLEYYIQAFDGVGNRTDSAVGTVIVQYCYIIR